MGRRAADIILSVAQTIWPWAMDFWQNWGIQWLVLASLAFQIILAVFGVRRRYSSGELTRFITWASYLLGSYTATFALGKLSVVNIRDPENPDYNVGLRGLLAPLLLMHLANPDCMCAYSNEDTGLAKRQMLSLLVSTVIVIWILFRCWDKYSPVSWLYIPLFVAGVIKLILTCWALFSIHDNTTSASEMKEVAKKSREELNGKFMSMDDGFLKSTLIAYNRFLCLKPHRVNWIYHPSFMGSDWKVDLSKPKDEFEITEIELGFVHDMIYTKSSILSTKIGFAGKAISLLCLFSTLCGFSIIFRNAFLLDLYVTYTYALLMGSSIVELYQIFLIPFSTWAIVKLHSKLNQKVLNFLVRACEKQRRWSNSLPQLDIDKYCDKRDCRKPIRDILRKFHQEVKLKGYCCRSRAYIDLELKEEVLNIMNHLEEKGYVKMPVSRGLWSLEIFKIPDNRSIIEDSIEKKEFGKSIIIWHIATKVLQSSTSSHKCSSHRVSGLLSNYMMYLLVHRPYVLSLTTSEITFGYASAKLKAFANSETSNGRSYKQSLLSNEFCQNFQEVKDGEEEEDGNFLTNKWDVLKEVNELVIELKNVSEEEKWEFLCSVWVEMLCYAAYNCPHYQHTTMLRRGGALITHVWLLLTHQIDKFPSEESNFPSEEYESRNASV